MLGASRRQAALTRAPVNTLAARSSRRQTTASSLRSSHRFRNIICQRSKYISMILKFSLPELDIHGPLPAMPTLASTVIPIVSIVSIRTGLAPLDCISSSSFFFLQCRIQNARLANACFASLKCSIGYSKVLRQSIVWPSKCFIKFIRTSSSFGRDS